MKKIGIILALFLGVLSVQAQSFEFDCAEGVLPTGGGITAGHILSHRGVILNTTDGVLTVNRRIFDKRGDTFYAPDGWSDPRYFNSARITYAENKLRLDYGIFSGNSTANTTVGLDQYSWLFDALLDKKGPAIFHHTPGAGVSKLSVDNKFLRGNGTYFETDNGYVYGGEVRGHIKFHLHNGVWDLDLKKDGRDRVYRSNLSFDELEGLVRIASADFQSAYNQLSTVGYNETDKTLWYGSKRWANVPGQPNQWQQPSSLRHEDGLSRAIVVTIISENRWIIHYSQPTSTGGYVRIRAEAASAHSVFGEIAAILRN